MSSDPSPPKYTTGAKEAAHSDWLYHSPHEVLISLYFKKDWVKCSLKQKDPKITQPWNSDAVITTKILGFRLTYTLYSKYNAITISCCFGPIHLPSHDTSCTLQLVFLALLTYSRKLVDQVFCVVCNNSLENDISSCKLCTQLTKTHMARRSCSQLFWLNLLRTYSRSIH